MWFWIGIFIISLIILIKSSDKFTESAEKFGISIGLPPFIVGVIILSIGTSLPELVSSIIASLNSQSGIIIGNIIGSNVANILLILGSAAILSKTLKITYDIENVDTPILFASIVLLYFVANDGKIDLVEGIVFLICFIVYLKYSMSTRSKEIIKEVSKEKKLIDRIDKKTVIYLILTPILIYLSADWLIESIIKMSEITGISKSVIATTALAIGTSLPELFVTISAAKRGNPEMAVGNVIGSNIFNILMILGVCALIKPIKISMDMINFGIPFLLMTTLLFLFSTLTKKITKWEGYIYIMLYIFFLFKIVF